MIKYLDKTSKKLINNCVEKINTTVFGCGLGEKSIITSELNLPVIYVASDQISANRLYENISCFSDNVNLLTNRISNFTFANFVKNSPMIDFCKVLAKVEQSITIITPEVLTQKLPENQEFKKNILEISVNLNISREFLVKKLINIGFLKTDMVASVGQFSVRGDIVDLFPSNVSNPIRVSFFDDFIENIYFFNADTFSTIEKINQIKIYPVSFIFSESANLLEKIKKDKKNLENAKAENKTREIMEQVSEKIENNNFSDCVFCLPYLENVNSSILSYLPKNGVVIFDEPKKIIDGESLLEKEARGSFELLFSSGELFSAHKNFYLPENEVFNYAGTKVSFQSINTDNRIFKPDDVLKINTIMPENYNYNFIKLCNDLRSYKQLDFTVFVYGFDLETATKFRENFLKNSIEVNLINSENEATEHAINLIAKPLIFSAGFKDSCFVVISSNNLTSKRKKGFISSKNKSNVFTMPKVGDFVVHDIHGIGKCAGIKTLKLGDYSKDYLVVNFKGADVLYLPTENINNLSLYLGGEKEPKLNKLGGKEFEKAKQRVKEQVDSVAIELVKLYNDRKSLHGVKYPEDSPEMKEFEASFPYTETEDQLTAIADIKADMESGKVMDRLVCGDVGYGKTEVALRAAFKTILEGKQVAILVPTTILCEQHYSTVRERMGSFVVEYAKLDRFQNKKQQDEVVQKLKSGQVDIVCGTHRLLSSDVNFKDLGLLILDEEQRFGVKDKEKIKELKKNVNVLCLSATPIPRTLHMSMVGIRDISVIETPPNDRLPVQTFVTEYSDSLLADAIIKELNRDGQVLIVYNRVESIMAFAETVRKLVPEAHIGIAHGQMPEKELEQQIINLYNGTTNVMIATTLIENGVDLPRANTLFVVSADNLGLSQLYQLRGRVGRSSRLGYAFFTYVPEKALSEPAYKRLQALQEFCELGSGFKIAMRDLEIRGAGTVLGGAQHGHMEKVGYDMYCKLLNLAIKEINGQKVKQFKEVKINIPVDAVIPNEYNSNNEDRIKIYSALSEIKTKEELASTLDEISENFGRIPEQIINLGLVALIKNLCELLDVSNVTLNNGENRITFYEENDVKAKLMNNVLKEYSEFCVINYSAMPIIYFRIDKMGIVKKMQFVVDFLTKALNR